MKKLKRLSKSLNKFFMAYTWWEITIFIIGVLSFISIFATLFLPVGAGPSKIEPSGTVPQVGTTDFVRTVSDSLDIPLDNGEPVVILNNGDEFMSSLLSDIDNAKSSINFMVYDWANGKMSDQILAHLEKKLKEGVTVRIAIDGYGGKLASMKKFKEDGGKVWTFHSLDYTPWNLARFHKRNHRRAVIIDGKIAYTGGIAVRDNWLGNAEDKDHWRDMMIRTTGTMASHIQGSFAELWSMTGELIVGNESYPSAMAPQKGSFNYVFLSSSPTEDTQILQKLILMSFLGAEQKIYITNPYFILDRALTFALIQKAKEGVDVRVLVPNKYNDSKLTRLASEYGYKELLEGGVKIYEYQPTFIHLKSMIVDGTWSVIGSANMDNRSRKLNEENVFGISDVKLGGDMEKIFLADLSKTKEITLNEWNKRGIWERVFEILARRLVQQY
jgi:cardiolipin synthase